MCMLEFSMTKGNQRFIRFNGWGIQMIGYNQKNLINGGSR